MVGAYNGRSKFAIGHVDSVHELGSEIRSFPSLARGAFAVARGWVCGSDGAPIDALDVSFGSEKLGTAILGLPRPDVAEQHGAGAHGSGFVVVFPALGSLGQHSLVFEAHANGEGLPLDMNCIVSIEPPRDPLAGRYERDDRWAYAIEGVYVDRDTPAPKNGENVAILATGDAAFIKVWVIDLVEQSPPAAIVARSGGVYLPAFDLLMRRDAAANVGMSISARCEFTVPVSPPLSGVWSVELFALGSDNSYAALGTVRLREVSPLPLAALPRNGRILGHLDDATIDGVAVPAANEIAIASGGILSLRGWALDEVGPRLCGGVFAIVEGASTCEASYGGLRNDVATSLEASGIASCEFKVTIDTESLPPGRHRVSLVALTARHDALGVFGSPLFINVRSSVRR